ncbi:MAG: sulfotransferase [Gammaproteobacteria bacterium]|nr:sulfotransferase [Gammaproteobacteria bacterium]
MAFGLLNALHWIGFLMDELCFRGYRHVDVERPIAIVGIPRSGTTFLQRALATEPRFTTLTLFECILAPSVTERRIWLGLGRVLGRLVPHGRFRLARMEAIHPIGLDEPEEDFLLLLWVHACFLAVLACPASRRFWRLARFDHAVPNTEQNVVFDFYYRCLQKHLYYHGQAKRLLSKNPSFTPMLKSLRRRCPDAVIVGCVRAPTETVPSQLSSLLPAFELFGNGRIPPAFRGRMMDALHGYYGDLGDFARDDEIYIVEMSRLSTELEQVVDEIFAASGHEPSDEFRANLGELGSGGRAYQSAHRYSPADFELSETEIRRSFSSVWPLSLASPHSLPGS